VFEISDVIINLISLSSVSVHGKIKINNKKKSRNASNLMHATFNKGHKVSPGTLVQLQYRL